MNVKGRKSYSVTLKIPKEILNTHMKDIREIFQEICSRTISVNHRANVKRNKTTKGITHTFTVAFGSKQPNDLILYSIVKDLVQITLWKLLFQSYQDRASSLLSSCITRYEDDCLLKPVMHISVKPKEHIKLC